ncbi:hypothetical protein Lser_V15G18820 [Lactuca serriola]
MSLNATSSSNEVPSSNSEKPWTTNEVLVLTRCWLSVKDGVSLLAPPHCLVGDEWTHITALFNHEMGQGQQREKSDVVTIWIDVEEEVTWFNRACNYAKSSKHHCRDEEEFLEVVTDFYICKRDGRYFKYEEVWKVVKNN